MNRPQAIRLLPNATIALFSPSSPGPLKFSERYRWGIAALRQLGYTVLEDKSCSTDERYRSATPQQRAEEFSRLIADPQIDAILTTIGGLNSIEMLPYLDYDLIRANPTLICGYSDTSVLLNAIYARSGIVTFHGPAVIPSFGEFPEPLKETVAAFQAIASGQGPYALPIPASWTDEFLNWETDAWKQRARHQVANHGPDWLPNGQHRVVGTLIGGNLDSLLNIIGTDFWPQPTDAVLFIEDIATSPERWAMNLWTLRLRGVLHGIRALLIGKTEGMPQEVTAVILRIITEVLADVNPDLPVVTNLDIGHTAPMLTLPIGGTIAIDQVQQSLTLINW